MTVLNHILHLEKDPKYRESVSRIFSNRFEFRYATSIEEAETLLAEKNYDLVITTWMIRGYEIGIEWAKTLRMRNIPTLVLSGHSRTDEFYEGVIVMSKADFVPEELIQTAMDLIGITAE